MVIINLIVLVSATFISATVASLILLGLVAEIGASVGHSRALVMSAVIMCSGSASLPISSFPNINAASVEDQDKKPILKSSDFLKVGGCFSILTFVGSITITYGMSLLFGF
jgi:di/tricarboxylate transporter